jgi:hypothetical protein
VRPKAGLDAVKRKMSCPCRKSNPGRPARTPAIMLTGINIKELNFDLFLKCIRNMLSRDSSVGIATGVSRRSLNKMHIFI